MMTAATFGFVVLRKPAMVKSSALPAKKPGSVRDGAIRWNKRALPTTSATESRDELVITAGRALASKCDRKNPSRTALEATC